MLQLNEDFDYETILKSYSIQDVALEKSDKQKADDYKNYEEKLQEYREVKMKFLELKARRQDLRARFAEQLNINKAFLQLQDSSFSKLNAIQTEIQNVEQEISKDSEDFVNSVNNYMKNFQNLGTEFDESAIMKKQAECVENLNVTGREIEEKQVKLREVETRLREEHGNANDIATLRKTLSRFNEDSVAKELERNISENEKQLLTVNKNIEFLKQNNRELRLQCNIFE